MKGQYRHIRTPWGMSDWVQEFDNGIRGVSTPGHGGYWVPKRLLARIPQRFQDYAAKWSGSPQWYEEDIAWAAVAVSFPDLTCQGKRHFTAATLTDAEHTIAEWIDKEPQPAEVTQ